MRGSPLIEVDSEDCADSVVVSVRGEIDMATSAKLRRVLGDAMGRAPARVVVDLSAVEFMGSCGLAELLHAQSVAEARRCLLVLADVPPAVSRVLGAMGMTSLFSVAATVESALSTDTG